MVSEETSSSSQWSREQEKAFEDVVADYTEEDGDMWEQFEAAVPDKSREEIKHHYELLVEDVNAIEAGRVPLLDYISTSEGSAENGSGSKKGRHLHADSGHGGKARADQERRKGIAWTEDEHRLFLLGLDKYGKGDWRSISRNFVISRTPTQVASHAQKYFIRLNSMNKDRRRTSIHDITTVGSGEMAAPQGPITGQASGMPVNLGKSAKQLSQPSVGPPGIDMYGITIGKPVAGPLVSAVGTPVNLPVSGAPHMAFPVGPPVAGTMVSGAPVSLAPMTYPLPRPSTQR